MNNPSDNEVSLRNQLISHLKGGQAFSPIDKIVKEMPFERIGVVPESLPYSFYQQFYHIWYAQRDILEYCRNEDYQSPAWPEDYWPEKHAPDQKSEWKELIQKYFDDRDSLCQYIQNSATDLFQPVPSNPDHTLFREIELVIEHTAYHTGQLYVISRLLKK